MSREKALSNLKEMKTEIEAVYYEIEKANGILKTLEEMSEEHKNPKPFVFKGKNVNTAGDLKSKYIAKNQSKIKNNRMFERIWIIIASFLAIAFNWVVLSIINGTGIIYLTDKPIPAPLLLPGITKPMETTLEIIFFVFLHVVLTLAAVVPAYCEYWSSKHSVPIFMLFILPWIWVPTGICAFLYWAIFESFVLNFLVMLVAIQIPLIVARIIKFILSKCPILTVKQKAEINQAKSIDKQSKLDNIENEKIAKEEYEKNLIARRAQIERDWDPMYAEAEKAKEEAIKHADKLDTLDYLAEEDKTIPIIDMLTNIIRTHRADSIKEALQEYDKIKRDEQLMEIENAKLEAMRQQAAQERADRQRQYERQLEIARQANQQAHDDAMRLYQQQQWHNDAMEKAARASASNLRSVSNTLYDIKNQEYNEFLLNR